MSFESNEGQTDSQVKFLSHGDGYSLFLTSNEAVFTLRTPAGVDAPPRFSAWNSPVPGRDSQVYGTEKLPGAANYFIGTDQDEMAQRHRRVWQSELPRHLSGHRRRFLRQPRQLEYDFAIAPGADPRQISLAITGAAPSLDGEGNVSLKLPDGELALKKPIVYQDIDGRRKIGSKPVTPSPATKSGFI